MSCQEFICRIQHRLFHFYRVQWVSPQPLAWYFQNLLLIKGKWIDLKPCFSIDFSSKYQLIGFVKMKCWTPRILEFKNWRYMHHFFCLQSGFQFQNKFFGQWRIKVYSTSKFYPADQIITGKLFFAIIFVLGTRRRTNGIDRILFDFQSIKSSITITKFILIQIILKVISRSTNHS